MESFNRKLGIHYINPNPIIQKASEEIKTFKENLEKAISEFKFQDELKEFMRSYLFERYTLNLINLINPELIVFNGVETFKVVNNIFKKNITENELDRSEYQSEIENIKQKLPDITPFFLKGIIKSGKIKIMKDYDYMILYHTSGSVNPNIREYTKGFFKKFIENEYLKKLNFEVSKI